MEAAVSGIEKKIENLQISDVFPVKSEVTGKPDEAPKATSDKASDKNLAKPESKAIDKPISPADKPAEHGKPVDKSADTKASLPSRPAVSEQAKATEPAPVSAAVQQPPTVTSVRSSSTSNEAKRSSLDGAQSKSANEKISYEIDFLKNLRDNSSSKQRPNFNLKQQVEILLSEPRTKDDSGHFNDIFDPGFGPMGRSGPVSILSSAVHSS